jgi:hypothetical protein
MGDPSFPVGQEGVAILGGIHGAPLTYEEYIWYTD